MTFAYLSAVLVIGLALSALMSIAWVVQQRTGNSGWGDTIWTFSVGLVGAVSAVGPLAGPVSHPRQWMVAGLVAIWSLRLGTHIAMRSVGIADDPRYAAFAGEWGLAAPRRMLLFLQQQAWGSIPLVFAVFVAAHVPDGAWRAQDYLGALVLFAGIAGAAIADGQLKAFRSNPANKGRVCDVGLWRKTHQPNNNNKKQKWLAYPVIALSPDYS